MVAAVACRNDCGDRSSGRCVVVLCPRVWWLHLRVACLTRGRDRYAAKGARLGKGHDADEAPVVDDRQVPDPVVPDRDRGAPDAEGALDAERQVRRAVAYPVVVPDRFLLHVDHRAQQTVQTEERVMAIASETWIRACRNIGAPLSRHLDQRHAGWSSYLPTA